MLFKNKNEAALKPPLGWNSWDNYAAAVTEEELLANAVELAKIKEYGWEYVVCDIEWSEINAGKNNQISEEFPLLVMDEYGRQLPAENRFPSAKNGQGFKPIADKIHDMGLKFGVHLMRGIPRDAVHRHLKVMGTDVTADKIAVHNSICNWSGDMYGIKDIPEGQAYYNSVFALFAQWGVDFVKVDDICHEHFYAQPPYHPYGEHEVRMIRKAIDNSGRAMVLSLSPGPAVIEKAWHMETCANMWRITDDFWDEWRLLKAMFERCEVWQAHVKPGCWPDCDMLPLGVIGKGFFDERKTKFTKIEQKTLMTLWTIFRSPLMMGGDLTKLDDWTRSLLTNKDLMDADQNGSEPTQLIRTENESVWTSKAADGGRFLALFNIGEEKNIFHIPMEMLDGAYAEYKNVWTGETGKVEDLQNITIDPHDCFYIRVK